MADSKTETRDRIRELVRQVLASVPSAAENVPAPPKADDHVPEHLVVNSMLDKVGKEYDRDESARPLITEDDLRGLGPGSKVRVSQNVKFTPLAADIINELGIQLIRKEQRKSMSKVRSIAVGSDHGGFKLKEQVKNYLTQYGLQVRDFGTNSEEAVDYPDFALAVARSVSGGQVDVGIIVDGAGIGSAMTANKVPNVRAAACYSPALARNSREHNGANVLTLGSGQNTFEEAKVIVDAFISTEISEERHKKRVGKIDNIDRQYRK